MTTRNWSRWPSFCRFKLLYQITRPFSSRQWWLIRNRPAKRQGGTYTPQIIGNPQIPEKTNCLGLRSKEHLLKPRRLSDWCPLFPTYLTRATARTFKHPFVKPTCDPHNMRRIYQILRLSESFHTVLLSSLTNSTYFNYRINNNFLLP